MRLAVEEYRLDIAAKTLSEETLVCPPPFNFSNYESVEKTKNCPAKDGTEKDPCAECWKRWLLSEY
jgi:hypothetical protein